MFSVGWDCISLRPQVLRGVHPGGFQHEEGRDCPYDEEHREGAGGEEPPRQLYLDGEQLEQGDADTPCHERADEGGGERNLQQVDEEEALYVGYRGSVDDADGYLGVAAADFVADVGGESDEGDNQDAQPGEEDAVAHVQRAGCCRTGCPFPVRGYRRVSPGWASSVIRRFVRLSCLRASDGAGG